MVTCARTPDPKCWGNWPQKPQSFFSHGVALLLTPLTQCVAGAQQRSSRWVLCPCEGSMSSYSSFINVNRLCKPMQWNIPCWEASRFTAVGCWWLLASQENYTKYPTLHLPFQYYSLAINPDAECLMCCLWNLQPWLNWLFRDKMCVSVLL